jgi:hypothetical protein
MTTAEQLQFNVLAAPLASVDRRALSQAWYSALYGTGAQPASAAPKHRTAPLARSGAAPAARGAQNAPAYGTHRTLEKPPESERAALPPANERRTPRAPLAKKIERTLLQPGASARSATFRVGKGRVHVVVQQRPHGLQLVALCARGAYANVAQALMQARFALAQRGIALETKLYDEGAAV